MGDLSYILITPVKNEEEHLPKAASCVEQQSHRPVVWVIVDDGSRDRTPDVARELTARHTWIHTIRLEEDRDRTFGSHLFEVFRLGLERGLELAGDAEYVCNLDADVRFHDDTFLILCAAMDREAELAIASPRLMTLTDEVDVDLLKCPETILADRKLIVRTDKNRTNEPTNGIRIYRRRFLDEIGGFPVNDAADDMILGKAVMLGYRIGFVDAVWGYLTRSSGTTLKSDYLRGKFKGYRQYIVHYHTLLVMASIIWYLFNRPAWAIGALVGYLESFAGRKKRISDPDVTAYFGRVRAREVLRFITRRVRP